jgi:hypothetical protein
MHCREAEAVKVSILELGGGGGGLLACHHNIPSDEPVQYFPEYSIKLKPILPPHPFKPCFVIYTTNCRRREIHICISIFGLAIIAHHVNFFFFFFFAIARSSSTVYVTLKVQLFNLQKRDETLV